MDGESVTLDARALPEAVRCILSDLLKSQQPATTEATGVPAMPRVVTESSPLSAAAQACPSTAEANSMTGGSLLVDDKTKPNISVRDVVCEFSGASTDCFVLTVHESGPQAMSWTEKVYFDRKRLLQSDKDSVWSGLAEYPQELARAINKNGISTAPTWRKQQHELVGMKINDEDFVCGFALERHAGSRARVSAAAAKYVVRPKDGEDALARRAPAP
jgi:hypothetical protein